MKVNLFPQRFFIEAKFKINNLFKMYKNRRVFFYKYTEKGIYVKYFF